MSDAEHDHDRASDGGGGAEDTSEPGINYIPIRQFVAEGYLQELNRQFLHPLGLALEVVGPKDGEQGEYRLGGVWDYRDDKEGMRFADDTMEYEKSERIRREQEAKSVMRKAALGYVIQPPPTAPAAD